ncbi:cell division protein FtsX [Ectothiorhodospira mobilis]|uniref:Cell division protein FtsX n=1 Tax=Ectothiorhodospira mobilis TaxID=195064 RepID=A0A1I4S6F1_ECTMO|nr:permease-like cell division protein FtsX [Ectothiorhodospira mobilis]SFM60078.1 cell division protein FtsX [Ectothiorhodospira mobilis]
MKSPRRRSRNPTMHARLQAFGVHHARALLFSLGKLTQAPFSTLLTLMVIAVAITLPALLYLMLANLQQAAPAWERETRLSAFVADAVTDTELPDLAARLARREDVAATESIPRAQALEEFRAHSGLGDALDLLEENPLPAVILVEPAPDARDPEALRALANALEAHPSISQVQLDMEWVQRLGALLQTLDRLVDLLALLLGLGVVLVVGNTVRLDIHNRRREIEVAKLVGATDAFIRRPFLYGGIWMGLGGGLLALLTLAVLHGSLSGPVQTLARAYGGGFVLRGLQPAEALALLGTAAALGLAGAWVSVFFHIREIEPR